MNKNKKYRRLRYLVYKYDSFKNNLDDIDLISHLDKMIEYSNQIDSKIGKKRFLAFSEIKSIVLELNISKEEYFIIYAKESKRKYLAQNNLKLNTIKETRDNKGVYIGNGGSNINKVRYPKKNRSKKTWKIFYKMFPNKAEKDEWNGQTSKRMK